MAKWTPSFEKVKAFDLMLAGIYSFVLSGGAIIVNDMRYDCVSPIEIVFLFSLIAAFMVVGYERRFLYNGDGLDGMNA